ncbi:MAG: DUF1311 domain-containing protein [Armatimonadetes bacterium]|nr:DUF1311 domain-containing protein [Armatimonadota bacterium]
MRSRLALAAVLGAVGLVAPMLAQSQQEMNQQAWRDAEAADRKLNEVYRKLLPLLPDKVATDKLREAQRAWVRFRDLECRFAGDEMRDGSAEPLLRAGCQKQLTEERTKQLEDYIHDYKNDR